MAYKTCEDCGTKLQGGACPNCHEETFIVEQYREQGMGLPSNDSAFMQNAIRQGLELLNRSSPPERQPLVFSKTQVDIFIAQGEKVDIEKMTVNDLPFVWRPDIF